MRFFPASLQHSRLPFSSVVSLRAVFLRAASLRAVPPFSLFSLFAALILLFVSPLASPALVTKVVLEDFESGGTHSAAAATAANSSSGGATNSAAANVTESGSKRLKMTDPNGSYNGLVLQFTGVIPEAGNWLITADIKVDNAAAAIDTFGMAAVIGGPVTSKISDANAGYVMNLFNYTTTAASLGYQTIGCAVQAAAGATYPLSITLYFSTDPSRASDSTLPANDGNFNGGHRSLATAWASANDAVYIDNIRLIGPGRFGEDRHLWISIGDGYTNLTTLESTLVAAKNNNFNAVDILARYRANHYYRKNRDFSTYANPEPYASGASDTNDPIQYAIDRGHELGLKVYASFSCFLVTDGSNTYPAYAPSGSVTWVYNSGTPRAMTAGTSGDSDEGLWMDPGRADVRTYTLNILKDLVQNYDLDGVIFDRIRYAGSSFGYNPTALSEMGISGTPTTSDATFVNGRRDAITTFLHDAYESCTAIKPWMVMGTVPIAYGNSLSSTYTGAYQHWPKWSSVRTANRNLSFGCQDLTQPQFYRLPSSAAPYTAPAANQTLMLRAAFGDVASFSKDFGLMPGAMVNCAPLFYHPPSSVEADRGGLAAANAQNICDARQTSTYFMNGSGLYSAEDTLADISAIRAASSSPCGTNVFASWANPSDFLMKANYDNTPPNSITNLSADTSQVGRIVLQWTAPAAAADGETPARYLVYRSAANPVKLYYANLVNKNYNVAANTFTDSGTTGLSAGSWYYKVIPVDDYNNKSSCNQIGPITANTPADYIIESGSGGKHYSDYSEISGDWQDSSSKSTAAGVTTGIKSRFATLETKNDVARYSPTGLAAGSNYYDIYYTSYGYGSANCENATWRVQTTSGVSSGLFSVTAANTGNKWYKLGQFILANTGGWLEVGSASSTTTPNGSNTRICSDAVKFVYIGPAATPSPTAVPSATATPTSSPTATPSPTATASPSRTPTSSPTVSPTVSRTTFPTASLTAPPTASLTLSPTASPTVSPSFTATASPSQTLTPSPSATKSPSPSPTASLAPSPIPSLTASLTPVSTPTFTPLPTATAMGNAWYYY